MAIAIVEKMVLLLKRQVSQNNDKNIGSSTTSSNSASSLLSTLIPTFLIALLMVVAFLFLRRVQRRQYAPRTYVGSLREFERSPALDNSLFGWFPQMQKIPDSYVLQHNGLDAYFLLRFLKISIIICFVGCLITWPVLFPINATGGAGNKQLDILNFSNVADKNRYYAHALVAWIFIGFVFFMVTRESIYYINLRQAYLLSPMYASRLSSRTVLFTSVPTEYTNELKIRRMFGKQLKNVWVATDTEKLSKMVEERTKVSLKLEGAETKLLKLANDARLKQHKNNTHDEESRIHETEIGEESGSAAAIYVPAKKRPTHRTKFLIGKKVDTINWSREELRRLNPLIEREQANHRAGEAKTSNAVFVEFFNQTDAQAAYQMVAHHQPLHMSPRVIGFAPEDVVWDNLSITWRSRVIRNILTIAAVVVTIIFWSIPVAVVGCISNINFLTQKVHFLSFINHIPTVILGVVTGLLPTIMLAVLMALLPIYLRFMAKTGGLPTRSLIELRTQNFYFWFQVIQVFLITTLSSAISAAIQEILNNPSSVTTLLAQNLPKASNFYISYFILQGLSFSSGALLQLVGLVLAKVLGKFLDSTPRKMYTRWANLATIGWGTVFPVMSLLTVIAITYSCIAPLVMGFSTIGLYLFYLAFRYNLLFVQSGAVDTKGLVYPRALQHILVGCYLSMICLIGLFGIRGAAGPIVLTVVLLVICILYHISLQSAIGPLLLYLPRSLEAEEEQLLNDEEKFLSQHNSVGGTTNGSSTADEKHGVTNNSIPLPPAPHAKPSMIKKFLRPDIYLDYQTCRRLVPRDFGTISYTEAVEKNAYYQPSIKDRPRTLWIPHDSMGISRQEIAHSRDAIPMTDLHAGFDDKGKITWDMEGSNGQPPIYEEKIYY